MISNAKKYIEQFNMLPKYYRVIMAGMVVVIVILGVVDGRQRALIKNLRTTSVTNTAAAADSEVATIVAAVGKLLVLPTNEVPTLATVTDPSKLRNQPFFANAQVGDKVLIYSTSRKAILWRPSESKIIEVASVNVDTPSEGH